MINFMDGTNQKSRAGDSSKPIERAEKVPFRQSGPLLIADRKLMASIANQ
jgi:hypothetical protein|tara:strand:- start:2021 stop:2170 length:150 start_codon:yes stop_codon:yes gene_type:complete